MLKIKETLNTPCIDFNSNGEMEIKGRSIPEDARTFYEPVLKWAENYSQSPAMKTIVKVKLDYFNTSSSICLLDIFKAFERLSKNGHDVAINWYYEEDDEDIIEAGGDYDCILRLNFSLIKNETGNG